MLGAALALLAACRTDETTRSDLIVRRGSFRASTILTGELEAARGHEIRVPILPDWRATLEWLAEDGREVKEGDRVAELDPTPFLQPLVQNELAAISAGHELARIEESNRAEMIRRALDLEERRIAVQKAELASDVPPELEAEIRRREKELALARAEVERFKASGDLEAYRVGARADLTVQQLVRTQAVREVESSRNAIDSLSLLAPASGVLVVAEHRREGRKLAPGDSIFVGWPVASIPDLASLRVAARLADVDDGRVEVGQEAEAVLDAFPGETYAGRVVEVGRVAQEEAGGSLRRFYRVLVELDRSDPARMLPGHSVKVVVHGAARADVLLVPRLAIENDARVLLADGRRVDVAIGPCDAQVCVIEHPPEGIAEGTRLGRAGNES